MSPSPDDDLDDAALWRALAHAPDQAAAPDWRVRKAILREAHEAVGAGADARSASESKPWWQRLPGMGGKSSRMPWNAAFATLLVGVLVTLLWQREPVPGPRLDGEAAVPTAPAQKPAPVAPPQAPQAAEPAPAPPPAPAPAPEPPAAAVAPAAPPPAPPHRESRAAPAKEAAPKPPSGEAAPAGAAAPAPTLVLPESPAADAAARFAAPPALASRAREAPEREAPKRAAAAPSVRTDATEPPSFAALSQWTRLRISERNGASRTISRPEGRELNALLGSAALSAVGPRPLAGAPEWRVTLERDGNVLAVFEIARDQVRWREGAEPPGTGTPSAPALAALREALREAVRPAPAEAAPAPAPSSPP